MLGLRRLFVELNLALQLITVRLARRIRGPVCLATPSGDKGSGAEDVADGRQSGEKGSSPTNGKSPGLNGANTAIRIPLELSALAAETNSPYLEKADRPRWWERAFPKVFHDKWESSVLGFTTMCLTGLSPAEVASHEGSDH